MAKIKITYKRAECIGSGACAAADPKNFIMAEDAKADLTNSNNIGDDVWEVEMEENTAVIEAAKACPVLVIKIKNLDTGEEIV